MKIKSFPTMTITLLLAIMSKITTSVNSPSIEEMCSSRIKFFEDHPEMKEKIDPISPLNG